MGCGIGDLSQIDAHIFRFNNKILPQQHKVLGIECHLRVKSFVGGGERATQVTWMYYLLVDVLANHHMVHVVFRL
jgi:hypothetical protein